MSSPDHRRHPADSLADLDRIVHEPARLMILLHLYAADHADFLYLMLQTGLTQGNLSSHIAKLESAGYVAVKKTFAGKMPRTILRLTRQGRTALTDYRDTIVKLLAAMPNQL